MKYSIFKIQIYDIVRKNRSELNKFVIDGRDVSSRKVSRLGVLEGWEPYAIGQAIAGRKDSRTDKGLQS